MAKGPKKGGPKGGPKRGPFGPPPMKKCSLLGGIWAQGGSQVGPKRAPKVTFYFPVWAHMGPYGPLGLWRAHIPGTFIDSRWNDQNGWKTGQKRAKNRSQPPILEPLLGTPFEPLWPGPSVKPLTNGGIWARGAQRGSKRGPKRGQIGPPLCTHAHIHCCP